jgi:nucleoside-diphosphate-sugar epimerase
MAVKKILITGGTGFIGKRLVSQLKNKNYSIKVLARNKVEIDKIEFIVGDILNKKTLMKAVKSCDEIIHLAAKKGCDGDYDDFYKVNVLGTKNILDEAVKNKIKRVIYLSSIVVFKESGNKLRNEDWKINVGSQNFYIKSKVEALKLVRKYNKLIPIVTIFPTFVLDLDGDFSEYKPVGGLMGFVWKTVGLGIPGGINALTGLKDKIINYVGLNDLVEVIIKILDSKIKNQEYIVGGENIPFDIYLKKMARKIKRKPWPVRIPMVISNLLGMDSSSQMNFSSKKIEKDLDWQAKEKI